MNAIRILLQACLALLLGALGTGVHAAVTVSSDCGAVIDGYGTTGFGQVEGFYVVPPLAALAAGPQVALQTGLGFGCSVTGNGTGLVRVAFDLTNTTGADTTAITFFAKVDVTGDDTTFLDKPGATQVAGAREPGRWAIDDFLAGGIDTQIGNGALANATTNCAPDCDAVLALQFAVGVLRPGETGHIVLGLSDDGSRLSGTFLTATSSATPGQAFTLSGTVEVVPEPGAWASLLAGLALLGVALRRQGRARR